MLECMYDVVGAWWATVGVLGVLGVLGVVGVVGVVGVLRDGRKVDASW